MNEFIPEVLQDIETALKAIWQGYLKIIFITFYTWFSMHHVHWIDKFWDKSIFVFSSKRDKANEAGNVYATFFP